MSLGNPDLSIVPTPLDLETFSPLLSSIIYLIHSSIDVLPEISGLQDSGDAIPTSWRHSLTNRENEMASSSAIIKVMIGIHFIIMERESVLCVEVDWTSGKLVT